MIEGFLYIVSSLGVTGMRSEITTDLASIVEVVRKNTDIPCAIGFGISNPEQAAHMAALSDGAIVGSAIIKLGEFPLVAAPTTDERVIAGLDCSDGVDRDATAFVVRKGTQILEMWKSSTIGHEEIVRRVLDANKQFHITKLNMDMAFSDYEFNVLKYELPCEQVNFARAATDENRERYANCRSEMFFNLAQTIRNGLCVNGFDLTSELKRQLCAIGWFRNNQNRLLLTKKEELREVLKMSTDVADALALTCLDLWKGDDPVMRQNMKKAAVSKDEEEKIMSEY